MRIPHGTLRRHRLPAPTARFIILGAWVLLLVVVALLWSFGPLDALWRPDLLADLDTRITQYPWIPLAALAVIVLGLQVAVPQGLLAAGATLLLGFWLGLATALLGTLIGAIITYQLGRWVARRPLRR